MAVPERRPETVPMIGTDPGLLSVLRQASRSAEYDVPVLITGETGTGKELVARRIHESSKRSAGPFVVIDCGMLSRELARSEIFGHQRGAFTGAVEHNSGLLRSAHGGTILLDEVGELNEGVQVQLLRFLQDGTYREVGGARTRLSDARVIAATHRELEQQVVDGQFRADLLYRLNTIRLRVPPLRERPDDILPLIHHFQSECRCQGIEPCRFSPEALEAMARHAWPGNVRELQQTVTGLSITVQGRSVEVSDLPFANTSSKGLEEDLFRLPYKVARRYSQERFSETYIRRALTRSNGNVSLAARESGIGRQYLQMMMAEHGISGRRFRQVP